MRSSMLRTLFVAVAIGGMLSSASAQPKDPASPSPAGEDRPDSADAMRAMLDRRLERFDREQTALREAKAMLDRGESVEKVREYLRDSVGEDVRERVQQWRERRDGPPEGRRPPVGKARGGGGPEDGDMFGPGREGPGREGPRGPGGPEAGPERAGDGPPMPADRALELLRDVNPPMYERLNRLRERNPEQFREALRRVSPRLAEFDLESRAHPGMWRLRVQMFRLEREARDVARKAVDAGDAEEQDAIAQLKTIVGEQFDLRVQMREQEVSDLTERVSEIRSHIDTASKDRESLVTARAHALIQEARQDDRPPPGGPRDGPPKRRGPAPGDPPPPRD